MNWILLTLVIFASTMQTVALKEYDLRTKGGAFVFSAGSALFAALFFVVSSSGNLNFTLDTLIYSVFFAIAYALCVICSYFAIQTGPLSFTSLISSYSLIIPTFYGIFALGEKMSIAFLIGLILLFVSLALINLKKQGETEIKISKKWIFFVVLAFFGNGMCTVVQKIQQDAFFGGYKSEFMIIALAIVFMVFAIIAGFTERKKLVQSFKGSHWFAQRGLFNGLVNLLVMILTARMNVSVMFPVISAGGVILTIVVSRLIYKEKFSAKQTVGFVLGGLAVVALNL